MSRNNTLRVVHTRPVYDIISSGNLTISNLAYAANDYLHTNQIIYSNAFLEQEDCFVKILGVRVREHITAGTLQKPALKIYIFNICDMNITANGDFDFADGTATTLDNINGSITVATLNYTDVKSAATTYDSFNNTWLNEPIICKLGSTNRTIPAIAVTTGTPTFDASATLSIDLIVEMA